MHTSHVPRGMLTLLILAASLAGAPVMRPSGALAVAGDVLAGSIVCHLHLAYDHRSGTDAETVSASGQMDVSYSFIFVGAGSPIHEHAHFSYTGSYSDVFPLSRTDIRATATGSLDAPSGLHPEDTFGENEIAQQPGGPYFIGPFGGSIPATGIWKSTYTSGSNIITQSHTLHGQVAAYDASMRGGHVPTGEHPALSGMTTHQVNQDTLNQGVPEIPPGLANGTTVTGYNRCMWHLVFIVFNGRRIPQVPSPSPTPDGTGSPTPTVSRTPLHGHLSSGTITDTPTMTATPTATGTAQPGGGSGSVTPTSTATATPPSPTCGTTAAPAGQAAIRAPFTALSPRGDVSPRGVAQARFFIRSAQSPVRIDYFNGSGHFDVTTKTVQVMIGERITLSVDCTGSPLKGPIHWAITGLANDLKTTSAIANYQIVDSKQPAANRANVTLLGGNALTRQHLSFYFIRGSALRVGVTTGSGTAEVTFMVHDPELLAPPDVRFCTVGVANERFTSPKGSKTDPPTLGLGYNETCGAHPGITWRFQVRLPQVRDGVTNALIGGGRVRMTQLISRTVSNQFGPCEQQIAPAADVSSFYDTAFGGFGGVIALPNEVTGQAGATVTWADSDGPWIHLRFPTNEYTETFYAWDYIMYRSNRPGSIWIPIGELVWHWQGTARFVPRTLRWVNERSNTFNPTMSNSSFTNRVIAPLPTWSEALPPNSLSGLC